MLFADMRNLILPEDERPPLVSSVPTEAIARVHINRHKPSIAPAPVPVGNTTPDRSIEPIRGTPWVFDRCLHVLLDTSFIADRRFSNGFGGRHVAGLHFG